MSIICTAYNNLNNNDCEEMHTVLTAKPKPKSKSI
jgi:hypothetical protein